MNSWNVSNCESDLIKGEVSPVVALSETLMSSFLSSSSSSKRAIFNGLFAKFNFTVTESTPLDVEVAVDPEMLGKIFEELVTGRHETGSYYTPKPIVSFMCREALKGFLESNASGENKDAIERFVEKYEPDDLRNAETVLDALRKVKICDPACGSGAYLLGMLHELLDLRTALFQSRKLDAKSVYDRKLEIIQSNIYGVDLDQFAVNIARLRLWLSLAVDYEGSKPEPLPNLDYKVEVGDSLLGPNPSGGLEMGFRKQLIDDFLNFKAQYLTAHHSSKKDLKAKIDKLKADIASFGGHTHSAGLDWALEFAEVFVGGGGFDIALANPPYVRQELITDLKPALEAMYPSIYGGRADLYCYFYGRAFELLKNTGMLVFISPDKWFRSKYGSKLRQYATEHSCIRSITDFGELPVFEAASTFPMIFVARKGSVSCQAPLFTQVMSLAAPYPDVLALIREQGSVLPQTAINGSNWVLTSAGAWQTIAQMESIGVPLSRYARATIYSGIKTGLNTAFWIDSATRSKLIAADKSSLRLLKRLARGDDVRKWHIRDSGLYLIFTPPGTDIDAYPAVKKYLASYRAQLEKRAVKQPWWELQQAQNKAGVWTGPKII